MHTYIPVYLHTHAHAHTYAHIRYCYTYVYIGHRRAQTQRPTLDFR